MAYQVGDYVMYKGNPNPQSRSRYTGEVTAVDGDNVTILGSDGNTYERPASAVQTTPRPDGSV